jgi:hypothetical protein
MKKWFVRVLLALGALILLGYAWVHYRMRDRHPGYEVDLLKVGDSPGAISAGFAALPITPQTPDTWIDANGDAQYRPKDGDTYEDRNGNGRFDAVWLAGFQNKRPAMGVHDDLWARAMIVDDGHTRLALVSLDAIGFMADDVIDTRKRLSAELGVDYLIITATHTHQAPDLLGMWGDKRFSSGVNRSYLEYVKRQTLAAAEQAVNAMRPARLRFAQDLTGAAELVEDSRPPIVLDPGIRLMQAVDAEADTTLGLLFAWANHPETLWNGNLLLTSDFPHFTREAMEKGVYEGDSLRMPGLGGVTVYVNGAIGGLMTTSPGFGVADPFNDTVYVEASFDKARAQGLRLAQLAFAALADSSRTKEIERGAIALRAKTFLIPLQNRLYRLAAVLGVFDRGSPKLFAVRTEVAAWRLGPASFIHQPGEIYPEIVNGGVVTSPGADFPVDPVETPPVRDLMPGEFKFMVGLSNDMIGYIIPRSQWDEKPPYHFGQTQAPYGEINSVGPETGPRVYAAMKEVINAIQP